MTGESPSSKQNLLATATIGRQGLPTYESHIGHTSAALPMYGPERVSEVQIHTSASLPIYGRQAPRPGLPIHRSAARAAPIGRPMNCRSMTGKQRKVRQR